MHAAAAAALVWARHTLTLPDECAAGSWQAAGRKAV